MTAVWSMKNMFQHCTEIYTEKLQEILKADKKRKDDYIDYILLNKIGNAVIKPLPFSIIEKALLAYEGNN